jgi:hypothetical protein
MTHAAQFALAHGAALLFTWILLQQAGVPIPSAPLLIAVGSLASYGRGSLTWSGSYIALGYLLHGQLHWALAQTLRPLFIVRVAVSLARLWRRRSLAHAAMLVLATVSFCVLRPVSQHTTASTMSTRMLHDSRRLTECADRQCEAQEGHPALYSGALTSPPA